MNFPKKTARQFVVVLMVCAMILSGITMPQIVALASDSIDLSSYIVTDSTTDAATAEGENKPSASVLLNLPDNMNDRSELDALGVTGLTVTLTAVNYSAYSGETAGVLAFLQNSTDYAWYDGESWTALNNGSVSLTMDMSSADWGSGSSVGKIGIQFTNLAEGSTVDYQITSIAFTTSGGGTSGGGGSDPTTDYNYPDIDYNYARLLQYSLYFYDANMCGSEVGEKSLLSWRDDCHTFDRTTYTRSDGSIVNVDLTGGFHDAGDHVKFGLPEAYAAFVLGMSYDTDQSAYEAAKQTGHLKTLTTHFADYFVNCTVLNADGTAVEAFCYQVGQGGGGYDHGYWGAPEAQTNSNRPIHFTGSGDYATDIVSLSAAALAMQYRNFGGDEYLATAEKLFEYARTNDKMTGTYGADFYKSTAWQDDYCLAALLLYKITGKDVYQTEFNKYASDSEAQKGYWPLGWDNVGPAVAYYNGNKTTLANVMNLSDGNSAHDGYRCLSDWGSARYNTSMQYTGLLYDKMTNSSIYKTWAEGQMNFLLGNNSGKQCFIVGYNSFSSKYPHHRAASGYTGGSKGTTTQAHVLLGALVGGQKLDGSYTDSADDYICNEVAIDYNATLVAAAAALYNLNSSDTETQYIDPEYYGGTGESGGSTTEEDKTTTEDKTTEEDKTTTEDKTTEEDKTTTEDKTTEEDKTTTEDKTTGEDKTTTEDKTTEEDKTTTEDKTTADPDDPDDPVDPDQPVGVTGIEMSQKTATVQVGDAFTLTATVKPENAADKTLEWISSAPEVAEVDQNGKVTAKASGTTVIIARSSNGVYAQCSVTVSEAFVLETPTITALSNKASGMNITWNIVEGADGYILYRKLTGETKYEQLAQISGGTTDSYLDTSAVSGKTCYYRIAAYSGDKESARSSVKNKIYVGTTRITKAVNAEKGITLTWKKVSGATRYDIYRKSTGQNKSVKVKTITSGSVVKWTDTKATGNGKIYTYYIISYKGSVRGAASSATKTVCVGRPSLGSLTAKTGGKMLVQWKKNSEAGGYQIQYGTSSSMSGAKTVTIVGKNTTSKILSGLVKGKKYYVRIRTYKTMTGKKYYSAWSTKKSLTVTK